MLALQRARSRCQISAGQLGSPIWRAASSAARCSSAGSVRERSEKCSASLPALASKLAPRSAQASPSAFSSSAVAAPSPAMARTPLEAIEATALARPACPAGSRRLPASKSSCTSTMGMTGLSTSQTWAPLGSVQCWMGSSAQAELTPNRAPALISKALTAIFLIVNMLCLGCGVSGAWRRRPVRCAWPWHPAAAAAAWPR